MKKLQFLIIINLLTTVLTAQNVNFTCQAPSVVAKGMPFNVVFTLTAPQKGKNFKKPETKDFKFQNLATSISTSSSITIINGKISRQQTITRQWTITYTADKEGTFTLPPASVTVAGKTYKSKPVTIQVEKNNITQTATNQTTHGNITPSGKLFLRMTTNKSSCYVGEPIYVQCQMYSVYDVSLENFEPAVFENFWTKDIKMPSSIKASSVILNNKKYLTAVLDKKVVFPQKSGELSIKPYKATFQIYDGWGFPYGSKDVISNSKTIKVKPLPPNAPQNFSGAVGDFKISLKCDKKEVYTDDALNITLKISGTGNFELFDMPQITVPATFESLNPDQNLSTEVTPNGITGSQTTQYAYIARVPGKYKIPPVKFSFFNPQKNKYFTISTDTLFINVIGDTSKNFNLAQKSQAISLGKDIHYIQTGKIKLKKKNNFIFGTKLYWAAFYIPLILMLIFIILMRKRIKERTDISNFRSKRAEKISKKRLKTAEKLLQQGAKDKFYEAILSALWGYVSDKLSIEQASLTRDNVKEMMNKHNVPVELTDNFIKLIDNCETARYAPTASDISEKEIYNKAAEIIQNFEKIILKTK